MSNELSFSSINTVKIFNSAQPIIYKTIKFYNTIPIIIIMSIGK